MAVCKTVGIAYVGSNPTPATSKINRLSLGNSNCLPLGMTRRGPFLSRFDWPGCVRPDTAGRSPYDPNSSRLAGRQEHIPFRLTYWDQITHDLWPSTPPPPRPQRRCGSKGSSRSGQALSPSRGCGRTRRRSSSSSSLRRRDPPGDLICSTNAIESLNAATGEPSGSVHGSTGARGERCAEGTNVARCIDSAHSEVVRRTL